MRAALISVSALLIASSLASAGAPPSRSQVTLRAFVLPPSGLLFGLHPTEARIVVTAIADEPLRVCEAGTTFGRHWKGGCRRLARLPLALPTSGGAVHVAFRVMPSRPAAQRVTMPRVAMLRVRWHCVDHAFVVLRRATRVAAAAPSFDC